MESAENKTGYIENLQRVAQNTLLQSIAEHGLCASIEGERLRSYDKEHNDKLSLYLILPEHQGKTLSNDPLINNLLVANPFLPGQTPFTMLVHKEATGIWPIILERSFMKKEPKLNENSDRLEWEDRLNSSVLFVLNYPTSADQNPTLKSFGFLKTACEIAFEWQTPETFNKSSIVAIIAPQNIAAICRQYFPDTLVYDARIKQKDTKIPGSDNSSYCVEYLEGPDYASVLESLVKQKKLPTKFACHATRLPSKRDFLKLPHLRAQLSLENFLAAFDTNSHEQALRRIASNFGCREDIEFLFSASPTLSIDAQASTNNRTALHCALYKKQLNIGMLQSLLKFNPRLDIPDNAQKTAQRIAEEKRISLEELKDGTYDKKLFRERGLKDPEVKALGFSTDSVGKDYERGWK